MPHRIAAVVATILVASTFIGSAAEKHWTGAVSTDWFEPGNWNPSSVPAGVDTALVLTNSSSTNSAVLSADVFIHSLIVGSNAVISGPGNLTATNLICTNAWLSGEGSIFIPTGGTFRVEGAQSTTLGRALHNDGHVVIGAGGAYIFISCYTVSNRGIFEIQGDRTITASFQEQCSFENTGMIVKTGGNGTNTFSMTLINRGEMRVLAGTLRLTHHFTNEGIVNVSEGATLAPLNCPLIPASCSLLGFGTLRFGRYPDANAILSTTVLTTNPIQPRIEIANPNSDPAGWGSPLLVLDSAVSIRECFLNGGGISGSNTVTISNLLWASGGFHGSGTIMIPTDGSLTVTGILGKYVQRQTLISFGNTEWRDSGRIGFDFHSRPLFLNRGAFRALGDGSWGWSTVNEGMFVRAGSTGLCVIGIVTNFGLIEVQSGTLMTAYGQLGGETYLNGGNLYTGQNKLLLSSGTVRGTGSIVSDPQTPCGSQYFNVEVSGGEIHPGNPFGLLMVEGHFRQRSQTRAVIEIGGTNAGIDHDQLIISRETSIESAGLSIVLRNGFRPAMGDRFEIARFLNEGHCISHPTNFSRISGSDLENGLILLPEYSSSNVVLVVTNMPAQRFYVANNLGGFKAFGGPYVHRIRFHGSPATNYVLQGSTTLTNWIDLFSNAEPIDLIDYVNDPTDYWKYSGYRFYRVRWGD